MSEPDDIPRIQRIPHGGAVEPAPRRHVDPGADGPFKPKPVPPPARPAVRLAQTILTVPAGAVADFRWRSRVTKTWENWSTRPGPCTILQPLACDLGEFRVRSVGVEFEPAA